MIKTREFCRVRKAADAVYSQAISLDSTQGQSFGSRREERETQRKICDDRTMLLTSAETSQTLTSDHPQQPSTSLQPSVFLYL